MPHRALLAAALALAAFAVPASVTAASWTYTDGSGATLTLDEVPTRIIASADAAAGLIPLGIRPVGIYADSPVADSKPLQGLDLAGIEIVGEAWGEIDIEKVAALEPEIVIAEYWPLDEAWSGGETITGPNSPLRALAPVTGPAVGDSILTLIEDYEKLAESLGADLAAQPIADDKAAFATARAQFEETVAAKPGLQVLAVWAAPDALYVAEPTGAAELMDFQRWGLDIITPEVADDRGYWETLSWERADKYQPDLILVDDRAASTLETALAQPTWTTMKAAEAGAVAAWPAFWLRNYGAYAHALDDLTAAIAAADENLVD
ncbi:ABC transporter substrate-binding protein [Devosia nitrariae]|uniref:ABC transporter substrate-binding protein n=1 Tax=Devosia nitrariae TaxID=2071872 RepID=A0ABQ5WDM8_9HYPH|nr:ABC transporter substrate-binding protein [Devosia nitrariae]GLQ57889.1 ABC transporter substrate-binding protein [Devosia nitrariae]